MASFEYPSSLYTNLGYHYISIHFDDKKNTTFITNQ